MIDNRTAPSAALILRLGTGGLFLAHAALKFFVFTPAGTAKFFESVGLPGPLGPVIILIETIVGFALILGVLPRLAALAGIPDLLGAIFTVHLANGFFFNNPNGGWEFPAFWVVALVVQALLGDGPFTLVHTSRLCKALALLKGKRTDCC
jgi:putative oxidoreductase